jgi:hypothetical protein
MESKNKRRSWDLFQKREVIAFMEVNTIKATMEKFKVSRGTIYDWKDQREAIMQNHNPKRRRLAGGGRKVSNLEIEYSALHFVNNLRERGQAVTGTLIQAHVEATAKAKDVDMKASSGWLTRFKERHEIVSRRATSFTPKSSADHEDSIRAFLNLLEKTKREHNLAEDTRIWNFDETPLYFDMPLATTLDFKGNREIIIRKSISSRKRFTAALTISSHGDKLPPFIIFPGKRGEVEHKSTGIVCVKQEKGFMNAEKFREWIEKILAPLPSRSSKEILLLDAFSAHADKKALKGLRDLKFIPVFIPGGCTSYLQPLDVVVNKPFKDHFRKRYMAWMANDALHTFTPKGNMRAAKAEEVAKWVKEAWSEIQTTTITKSFVVAGSQLSPNEEDNAEEAFLEKLRTRWQRKLAIPIDTQNRIIVSD